MAKPPVNPRKLALDIIEAYFSRGGQLKEIISGALQGSHLKELDRRFVFNLAKGSVRYYLRADFFISHLSSRSINKVDPSILNILRMGVYQAQFMDSVPAYSAVNESVKLARKVTRSATGFVNAVMRRITEIREPEEYIKKILAKKGANTVNIISNLYSFPEWIIKYWTGHFGEKTALRLCQKLNQVPSSYIWHNTNRYREKYPEKKDGEKSLLEDLENMKADPVSLGRKEAESLDDDFKKVFLPIAGGKGLNHGSLFGEAARIGSAMGLERNELFLKGIITVQDLSSQMGVKYFLDPQPGENILDCCAAPGGKTSFTWLLMKGSGNITAVDKTSEKMAMLKENILRLGMTNIETIISDASRDGFLGDMPQGYFDRIIVDAPCTAFGTIAKNPEVKYNRSYDDMERLSSLSVNIMSACHPYLKPGGRMMFYTCTISPVENGQAVRKFVKSMDGEYSIAQTGGIDMELQIMPYYLDTEGGYVCVLEKKDD
jgi:16S rRNA (cytosine967-C5)-methyltransferase